MMKLCAALMATCATVFASATALASPVPVLTGSFSGTAYNSVDGSTNFDGSTVAGTFSLTFSGSGDFSSPHDTMSEIGGFSTGGPSFVMSVNADGQHFAFDDLRTLYFVGTHFPGDGAPSSVRVLTEGSTGVGFDFLGDILRSSSLSDIVPGPIDFDASSLFFTNSPTLKAQVHLKEVSFFGSALPALVPEPSTLLLTPLALSALLVVLRKRKPARGALAMPVTVSTPC